MLKPATDKEVRIEEREGEIEFLTPWQRLVFARNRAQITALGWDSEGTGRLDINLLEKGEAGGDPAADRAGVWASPATPALRNATRGECGALRAS